MRKTKKVLALYRRGIKALKKINTIKRLERAVIALEQLAKIKTTKKGDIKITSIAYNGRRKKRRSAKQKAATRKLVAWNKRNR
jgi:ATP-dependent phosphoenolpyruvate carboxykinase